MIPPTSIDGTDITGATIDGQDVQEITVDGQTVFTSAFSRVDDFSTNTIGDYEVYNSSGLDPGGFSISGGEVTHQTDDLYYFLGYDVSSENLSSFFVEATCSGYPDNDYMLVMFVVDGSTMVQGGGRVQSNGAGIRTDSFPGTYTGDLNDYTETRWSTPFTQRLEYDAPTNTVSLIHNGSLEHTESFSHSGTITLCGLASGANSPASSWTRLEIGEL